MLSTFVIGGHSSELTFGNRRSPGLRALSTALALVYLWHCVPTRAFAKAPKAPRPVSVLERKGATQTPDAALQKKIEAREKAEAKQAARPRVLVLSDSLLKNIKGGQTFLPANAPKQPITQTPTGAPPSGGSNGRIATGVSNPSEPDWSPDGKWIVFTSQRGGGFDVCVVKSDGGTATVLVEGEDPSWAPNSRTVVYARRSGKGKSLSMLDVPTKQTKTVSRISGKNSQPSWAK